MIISHGIYRCETCEKELEVCENINPENHPASIKSLHNLSIGWVLRHQPDMLLVYCPYCNAENVFHYQD